MGRGREGLGWKKRRKMEEEEEEGKKAVAGTASLGRKDKPERLPPSSLLFLVFWIVSSTW